MAACVRMPTDRGGLSAVIAPLAMTQHVSFGSPFGLRIEATKRSCSSRGFGSDMALGLRATTFHPNRSYLRHAMFHSHL